VKSLIERIGLFDKPSRLQVLKPEQVVGACTEELDDRYRGLDAGVRQPLLADMRAEDAQLKEYMGKFRLAKWFEGTLDLARRSVAEEAREARKEEMGMRSVARQLQDIEAEITERQRKAALEMLRSKPRHRPRVRVGGSFRSSIRP